MNVKKINVWHDDKSEWVEYTVEELNEFFKFVQAPNWNVVREIFLHNSNFDAWMDIIFKSNSHAIYNSVYGTYVKQ